MRDYMVDWVPCDLAVDRELKNHSVVESNTRP